MFECSEEFSKEQLMRIKKMIHTEKFRYINSIIHACDLDFEEKLIIKHIKEYIYNYLSNRSPRNFSIEVDEFISFVENYSFIRTPRVLSPSENGLIKDRIQDIFPICNGYHIYGDFRCLKNNHFRGFYRRESYLGTDHKIYLSKDSMCSRELEVSNETRIEVDYNSLLSESVFNYFSQPVAKYYLLKDRSSFYTMLLTPNFLGSNQKLIHLDELGIEDIKANTHTNRLRVIKNGIVNLCQNKMDNDTITKIIEKVELQFAIQSFLKILIGPMDSNYGNTGIIVTGDNNGNITSIELAPAFDLDISFNVARELVKYDHISQIRDSNGNPSNIESVIWEFKDTPGFMDFIGNLANKMQNCDIAKEILDDVYSRTNRNFFIEKRDDYMYFINKRLVEVVRVYKDVLLNDSENKKKYQ